MDQGWSLRWKENDFSGNLVEVCPTGVFTDSWAVSPKAPSGPARVDVIIGWKGKWGYVGPRFAVADQSGRC